MKNVTQVELEEEGYPDFNAIYLLERTLRYLYEDQECELSDRVVRGVSFEELIGALRVALRDLWNRELDRQEAERSAEEGFCYYCGHFEGY